MCASVKHSPPSILGRVEIDRVTFFYFSCCICVYTKETKKIAEKRFFSSPIAMRFFTFFGEYKGKRREK
jgi:hypothetical protein